MKDFFYISCKDDENGGKWYNLRVRSTHFCISAGPDLNVIRMVIKRYVKDYNYDPDLILRSLKNLSNGGRVSTATFEQGEKYVKEHGNDFKDFINQCIDEVAEDRKKAFRKKLTAKGLRTKFNRVNKLVI